MKIQELIDVAKSGEGITQRLALAAAAEHRWLLDCIDDAVSAMAEASSLYGLGFNAGRLEIKDTDESGVSYAEYHAHGERIRKLLANTILRLHSVRAGDGRVGSLLAAGDGGVKGLRGISDAAALVALAASPAEPKGGTPEDDEEIESLHQCWSDHLASLCTNIGVDPKSFDWSPRETTEETIGGIFGNILERLPGGAYYKPAEEAKA